MTSSDQVSGFLIPASRQRFLRSVNQLLTETSLVAIQGCTGLGKTTLIEELVTSALPDANKCYLTASSQLNDIQVRSRIVEQLFGNVLFDPEKPLLNACLEYTNESSMMIAIDNGHFLSGQIVGELLQVIAEFKKRKTDFSVLIAYDKQIANTIGSIDSALVCILDIPHLNESESYSLLCHYFTDLPSASNTRIKRWIETSKGIPIQLLSFEKSDTLSLAPSPTMNFRLWISSLVVISLVLALGVYVYRQYSSNEIKQPKPINERVVKSVPEPIVSDWSSAKVKKKAEAEKRNLLIKVATSTDILDALMITNAVMAEEVRPSSQVEREKDIATQSEIKDTAKTTNQNNTSEFTETQNAETQSTAPKNTTTKNIKPKTPAEKRVAGYVINNKQMLALPNNKFVLQLTAVSSEDTLELYLKDKKPNQKNTRIYKIIRNNADWLVVTYGIFDTIQQAREVAQSIDNKAWAKSVASIQQQIKSYNQSLSQ